MINILELEAVENQVEDWNQLSDADKWHMIAQIEALLSIEAVA
ncbi:MAG: hypothetical protein WCP64_07740 [Actinomycetes bacterium]